MNAVVEIAGQQFKVEPKSKVKVPRINGNPGDVVEFKNILSAQNGDNIKIGTPYIDGNVQAQIIGHGKDKKVLVFHKKRRKGYQKLNGHRTQFTTLEIGSFEIDGFDKIGVEFSDIAEETIEEETEEIQIDSEDISEDDQEEIQEINDEEESAEDTSDEETSDDDKETKE